MKFLVDTNVWLELLLEREHAAEARSFLEKAEASRLAISEFALYSLAVILTRLGKDSVFEDFVSDTIEDSGVARVCLDVAGLRRAVAARTQFSLDFDDAYQYAAAERHDLVIVSFDRDFDRTGRGRVTPAQADLG
ncbi:MAG: PIN domain-containing protein [Deltaproteobacteria bacterium]|nr:PIN domain-containing protein [Deltaproteobacteria bacterium]